MGSLLRGLRKDEFISKMAKTKRNAPGAQIKIVSSKQGVKNGSVVSHVRFLSYCFIYKIKVIISFKKC